MDWTGTDGQVAEGFTYSIAAAHELKSPLALIRQLSLSLEDDRLSAGDRMRVLRQITLTSERGLRLTSDLTRASRLEGGLFDLEPINPRQLCEDAAHEIWPLFKERGRDIQVQASRRQLLAVGNRDLLRRVIVNFSENALNYADSDSPVVIKTISLLAGGKVRVGVRDYGPALPYGVWSKLRQQLGKTPQPVSGRPFSSGLGLYINGQFASAMNGEIGATRHKDGATFYIDLPASHQMALL